MLWAFKESRLAYADVAPLKGVLNGGGKHRLEVEVDVVPLAG
ncbi:MULTISPECIES: hypothetical protein [unclassified Halomonas]